MARQILNEMRKSRVEAERAEVKKRKAEEKAKVKDKKATEKAKQATSKKTVQGGFSCGLCLCLCACLWVCSQHCPANVCLCV